MLKKTHHPPKHKPKQANLNSKESFLLSTFPFLLKNIKKNNSQLSLIANEMTIVNYDKHSLITTQFEKTMHSYIIIQGSVTIEHHYDILRKVTVKEYLKDLKDTRKNEQLEKTLAFNKDILPIKRLSDLDALNTIAYHVLLYEKAKDAEIDTMQILEFLSYYDESMEDNRSIANELCRAIEKEELDVNAWRRKIIEGFDDERCGAYIPLRSNEIYQLNFYCVDTITTLIKGDIICKEGVDVYKGVIKYTVKANDYCSLYKIKSTMLYYIIKGDGNKHANDAEAEGYYHKKATFHQWENDVSKADINGGNTPSKRLCILPKITLPINTMIEKTPKRNKQTDLRHLTINRLDSDIFTDRQPLRLLKMNNHSKTRNRIEIISKTMK